MLERILPQTITTTKADLASDNIRNDDAPATPAPLFAARAFRHLIWGTPKPDNSTSLPARPRRRASSTELQTLQRHKEATVETPAPQTPRAVSHHLSPSKRPGILLTPGTGGTRRKTVSFDYKTSKLDTRKACRNNPDGATEACAGVFSVRSTNKEALLKPERLEASNALDLPSKRSKPTSGTVEDKLAEDNTMDFTAPRSVSGQYWKREYDSYSAKSELELKRLLKNRRVAKTFAKHKEEEVVQLTEALHLAQTRVSDLEKQIANYQALLATVPSGGSRGSFFKQTDEESEDADPRNSPSKMIARQKHDLRVLQSSVPDANAQMKELRHSNQLLEARLRTSEQKQRMKTVSIPAHENSDSCPKTQKSTTPPQSPDTHPGRSFQAASSDIWADAGHNETTRHRTSSSSRQTNKPLMPINANSAQKHDEHSAETLKMGSERRAAALKRLQERRRNREHDRQSLR